MSDHDLIFDFCAWQRDYNQVSSARVKVQGILLRRLAEMLDYPITGLQPQDVERFLVSCEVKSSTTLKHLKMLRPFWKWMYRNKYIGAEQLMELQGVRPPRGAGWGAPRPYSRAEIGQFWKAFELAYPWTNDSDPFDRTPKRGEYWVRRFEAVRDPWEWTQCEPYARRLQAEAIVSLALFGGLRRVEILNLELDDFHYENAYIRVVGAAKNPGHEAIVRAVGWSPPMQHAVANWLEFRAQVIQPEHEHPWLNLCAERYQDPMKLDALAHMLGRIGKNGYSLHRLRHTFATERLRAGMPIEKLQAALGHTSIAMTLKYARIGHEDVVRATDQTNDEFVAALGREEGNENG